jgi:hypothetical protein
MSQTENTTQQDAPQDGREQLRRSPMMAHLLDALEKGTDVGHYGRLTFEMIARHFLSDEEIVDLLAHQPEQSEASVRAELRQVQERDYNPPKRERILEWQSKQDFPICPDPENPDACNVYQELDFPKDIYNNIKEYHEEQIEAEDAGAQSAS